MLAVHIIQQPLPILRPSKNRTHDWSDNGVCECVRPNNATVQWGGWVGRGGVGGARGEGEEGRSGPCLSRSSARQGKHLPSDDSQVSSVNKKGQQIQ